MNVLVERPLASTLSLTAVAFGVFFGGALGSAAAQIAFGLLMQALFPYPTF
jgi:hypothetical protein